MMERDSEKAVTRLRQLLNANFSERDIRIKISYSNCGDRGKECRQ